MLARSTVCSALAMLAAQAAAAEESVRKDYDCGDGKVVVWTTRDYEEQHVVVWFHDSAGKQVRPNVIAPGTFVPMCAQGVFLLLDTTGAHFIAGESWLMTARGETLGGFRLGDYIATYGVSDDEKIVWTQSFEMKGKAPRTRLIALGANGVIVHDQVYDAAAKAVVMHDGRRYPIDVLKPDLPY